MAVRPVVMTHSSHLLAPCALDLASTPQKARQSARHCLVTIGAQALALVMSLSRLLHHTPRQSAILSAVTRSLTNRRVLSTSRSMFQAVLAATSSVTLPSRPRMLNLFILHPAAFLLPSKYSLSEVRVLDSDTITVCFKLRTRRLWRWLSLKSSVNSVQFSSRSVVMESTCPLPSVSTP